jgi:signal transduction histidine kinase
MNDEMKLLINKYAERLLQISSHIENPFKGIDFSMFSKEDLLYTYDAYLRTATINTGIFLEPKETTQLITSIPDVTGKTVLNPFAGAMSYATQLEPSFLNFNGIDFGTYELGLLRLFISGKTERIRYIHSTKVYSDAAQYDLIITNPPYGMRCLFSENEKPVAAETLMLRHFENLSTKEGELYSYVPASLLFNQSNKALRTEITEKGFLYSVILLPSAILMPYTGIQIALVILKKEHVTNGVMKFVDASAMYTMENKKRVLDVNQILDVMRQENSPACKLVTKDEIKQNDYSWDTVKYFQKKVTYPEDYEVCTLSALTSRVNSAQLRFNEQGPLVRYADLSFDTINYQKSPKDFPISDNLLKATKVICPSLLISTMRSMRPTYCEASPENPIYLSSNIIALAVTSNAIHIGYLCNFITSSEDVRQRTLVPHISISEIMNMEIAYPSYNRQKELYETAKRESQLAKARELGLETIIADMKAEYINEVRLRKHDMRPYLRQLSSSEKLMRYYLSHKDGMENFDNTMLDQLDHIQAACQQLSNLLDHLSDEEEFGVPELFNLDVYFNNLTDHERFDIDYDCDEPALDMLGIGHQWAKKVQNLTNIESDGSNILQMLSNIPMDLSPLYVMIAPSDFQRLVENIIENAQKHGFVDPDRNDYSLYIYLSVDMERNMYQIDFRNNGTPLPEGMTKERFGTRGEKAGITGGTGCGGYIIKNIVTHYGGDYEVFNDNGITDIRIYLPIADNDHERTI